MRPWILIGNPENRRVRDFAAALEQAGKRFHVFAHRDLLVAPERLLEVPDVPHIVRMDSVGEDAEVEGALLRRGCAAAREMGVTVVEDFAPAPRGLIRAPRQAHLGFLDYLRSLEPVFAQRPEWTRLGSLSALQTLFDKRASSRAWSAAGLPVAERVEANTPAEIRAALAATEWPGLFIKVSCASSASCLLPRFNRH